MRLFLLLVALAPVALADPIHLRDGARVRLIDRVDHRESGLQEVRFDAARAFIGRRAIVQLDDDPARLAELHVRPLRAILPSLGYWLVESESAAEDGLALAERLQQAGFSGALPDLHFQRRRDGFTVPPNDPKYPGQWFYQKIGIEDAWRLESGSKDVTIAVIDNGCDAMHPDLVDKLDPGHNAITGSDDPSYAPNIKGNFHGTACAGLAAASTNNGIGVSGACPGCRLRCVKLLDDSGSGLIPISADMDAFQFVLDSGAAVASNSWGFTQATPVPQPLADAIMMVHTEGRGGLGTLVVFAAGNDNRTLGADELEATPGVTTVGAVNNFDEVAQFSNFGPSVAVVAPTGTLSTDISGADGDNPGDYIASFGGTSSACPIVAGIFGLMVSAAPKKSAGELEDLLRATAKQSMFATPDTMGHDNYYGYGLVQPGVALKMLKSPAASGCGCRVGSSDAPAPFSAFILVAVVFAWRRSRSRRA